MLGKIGQNEQNKEILTQSTALEKVQSTKSGSNSAIDKGLLIDETSISQDAIRLWEREIDVQKFTKFVLSDPDDKSAEELIQKQGLEGVLSVDDNEAIFNLLNNDKFLEDLAL